MHDLILPEGNTLPDSWREAKKVLHALGMKYEVIHACPNDCILYRGDHKDKESCPLCATPHYKDNMASNKVPQKAMRYFPLIPRLQHTYRCKDLAEYQVWHSKNRSSDGVMSLSVDSLAHQFMEDHWPDFKSNPQNV